VKIQAARVPLHHFRRQPEKATEQKIQRNIIKIEMKALPPTSQIRTITWLAFKTAEINRYKRSLAVTEESINGGFSSNKIIIST
jgi:hypothetical protein